jgi:stage II sporulation protein D
MTILPSSFFSPVRQKDGSYILYGGGYGHGLGMSQNGANGMAKSGADCEEILQYFYHDIKIEKM